MTSWNIGRQALILALIGVAALIAGVVLARPDVAVLGVPFVLSFGWGWLTRPDRTPAVAVRHATGRARAGRVGAELHIQEATHAPTIRLRGWTPGFRPVEALVAARRDRVLTLSVATARTGVQEFFHIDHVSAGFDAVFLTPVSSCGPLQIAVHPPLTTLTNGPLPPKTVGLTGTHTSLRIGDGTEFRDIGQFAPGDRLRRIDWKVTARHALTGRTGQITELYTRRTYATAEATLLLVVDSRDLVGPDVSTWGGGKVAGVAESTSLDLAREAATAVAHAVLASGDRVGLDDLGLRRWPVPPAAGQRHFERIARRLATLSPQSFPSARIRAPQVPSSALIVLFSTFLDDEAARMARQWRSRGHRVIAVDTLPEVHTAGLDPVGSVAYQVVALERGVRIERMRAEAVEVLSWDAGSHWPAAVAWRLLSRIRPHRRIGPATGRRGRR